MSVDDLRGRPDGTGHDSSRNTDTAAAQLQQLIEATADGLAASGSHTVTLSSQQFEALANGIIVEKPDKAEGRVSVSMGEDSATVTTPGLKIKDAPVIGDVTIRSLAWTIGNGDEGRLTTSRLDVDVAGVKSLAATPFIKNRLGNPNGVMDEFLGKKLDPILAGKGLAFGGGRYKIEGGKVNITATSKPVRRG